MKKDGKLNAHLFHVVFIFRFLPRSVFYETKILKKGMKKRAKKRCILFLCQVFYEKKF